MRIIKTLSGMATLVLGAAAIGLIFPLTMPGGLGASKAMAAGASIIRKIQVEGNRRVEDETVRTYMRIVPGQRFDPVKADASLKALYATGLFSDVSMERRRSVLVVFVVENPIVNKVVFEGNSAVDDDALGKEIQLKSRSIYTSARIQADTQRILSVYRRNGRFGATVVPKIINLQHNRIDVVYEIREGDKTNVRNITIIGNHAFSDSQLRDVITTTKTGMFSFMRSTNIYDPDRLSLDKELLRQFYIKNGYADARIVSAFADLDPSGEGFFITFAVEEGELYHFGEVDIVSRVPDISADELRSKIVTKTGNIYNASQIEKSVKGLTMEAAKLGYAFARIRPRADRDPVSRIIGITYEVQQGPRVYVERINIRGNHRTRDYVIRRVFRLAEGDAYNRVMVDAAKRDLKGLGYFKKVQIKNERGSAPDRVILNVSVVEQSTGELSVGGGYSTTEGVIGDVGISERNFLGKGQYVSLKAKLSSLTQEVEFSFTEPKFLDRDLSFGFDLFNKTTDNTSESSFKSRKTGGGIRFGFLFGEYTSVQTRYTLLQDEVFDVSNLASIGVKLSCGFVVSDPVTGAGSCTDGTSWVSSIGYTIVYDTRNHKSKPSRGFYASFSQDLAGVGGDVNYLRTYAEARAYYPVWNKVILALRVKGGHIVGWGGQDVRILDSYFMGEGLVRGFDRSGLGPRAIATATQTADALGATIFYGATAEVRFPTPYVPEELRLSNALFVDVGTAYDPGMIGATAFNDSSELRSSVGVGVMWDSPMGPLRADFAYVLSKAFFDKENFFSFGASTKF